MNKRQLMVIKGILIFFFISTVFCYYETKSQEQIWTVNALFSPSAGYIKFDNSGNENFYLFDNYGNEVYLDTNSTLFGGNYCKLLSNGYWSIYKDSKYHIYNQNMEFIETINLNVGYLVDVHDMNVLPNGHYILICVENRTMDLSQIVEGGNPNATVIGAHLYETDKDGTVYWTWSSFDNFNILDVTSEIDLTQPIVPFTHANSVTAAPDGNIILSCRNLDEITKINKATGDIIWRWGGKECKNNEFVFINDTIDGFFGFSHQHSISILPNGNFLFYDNGNMRPEPFSRAVEYRLDEENMTAEKVWEYRSIPDGYYSAKGSVQRLDNGNTFINWGEDKITEVRPDKSVAFEMRSSIYYPVYRAFRYKTRMNAIGMEVKNTSTYNFNQDTNETNIEIYVEQISGSSFAMIEKHYYSPIGASFYDSSFSSILPFRWVFSKRGITNISGEIRINLSNLNFTDDKNKLTVYARQSENAGAFRELVTKYEQTSDKLSADFSNMGEFIIGSNVLGKPVLTSPEDGDNSAISGGVLGWQSLLGALNYRLQLSESDTFTKLIIDTIVSSVSFRYEKLKNKKEYFWRVCGTNLKDTSNWSDIFSFITELGPPELSVPPNESEDLDLEILAVWESVTDSCIYRIQVSDTEDFSSLVYENQNVPVPQDSFKVNEYYQIYYWRVCSILGNDTSDWSSPWIFMTKMSEPQIISPSDRSINIPTEGIIIWNDVKGAAGYALQISLTLDFSDTIINQANLVTAEFLFSGLEHFKKYLLRIKAFNGKDTSGWSPISEFTTILDNPVLVEPEQGDVEIPLETVFYWETVFGAEMYRIELATDENFSNSITFKDSISSSQVQINSLPFNTNLYWKVQAFTGFHQSNWSDVRNFSTESGLYLSTPLLVFPENHSVGNEADGSLIWSEVEGADSYSIKVSKSVAFDLLLILDSNIISNNYPYSGFEYDSTYFWQVKAKNIEKESRWSKVFNFKIKSGTNVSDNISDNILIYPQPAGNFLQIKLFPDYVQDFKIVIFDALGRKMKGMESFYPVSDIIYYCNLDDLSDGLYFICINLGNKIISKKFIRLADL